MALSLINSGQGIHKSLIALFFKWGKYIGLSLILQDAISKRKDAVIFVSIFLFSAALTAVSGITQFFWGVEFLRGKEMAVMKGLSIAQGGVRAITSSFNHSNGLGAYLVIPLTLCVAFLGPPRMLKSRIYFIILFIAPIIIFAIFHTYCRGAWLGVLVALLAMFFISERFIIITIGFMLTGVFMLIPVFQRILLSIFRIGGDANRFQYWRGAVSMFQDKPLLGIGLGTFMDRFVEYMPNLGVVYAHNCFLQILAESGIFSLIAFVGFISSVLYIGIKKFRAVRDPILLGGICGVAGFLAHSFFEVNLYSLPLAVLFWLWVGMVAALSSGRISLKA